MLLPFIRRRFLLLVLALSLVLRTALALAGGQYFFGDEVRYNRGTNLYTAVLDGRWQAAREILARPEHAAFTVIAAALSAPHHLLAQLTPAGDWSRPENIFATAGIAAALLGLFSTVNLWLVHKLARRTGAHPSEAAWALLLAAAANSLLYYSRHLLPYDVALAAWLGSLVLVTGESKRGWFLGGVLAGLTYHCYNGYWFLCPAALFWPLWWHWRRPQRNSLFAAWLPGAFAGFGLPFAVGLLAGGSGYWHVLFAFSGTVTQGLFAEGWSFPWEYLWAAEGWLGVTVLAAIIIALAACRPVPRAVRGWLGVFVLLYALLVLVSTGLHKFVLYGRTVHPLVPLLCLAGGWALPRLLPEGTRLRAALAFGIAGLAVVHIAPHFAQVFPREVEMKVLANYGNPKRTLSFSGSLYRVLALPGTEPRLALVNAQYLYPLRTWTGYPAGESVFSFTHPLAYRPFQYEGHNPRERRLLREHDVAIRLIRLADPPSVPFHPLPASIFGPADQPDGYDRQSR